jgi:hypothetical protein
MPCPTLPRTGAPPLFEAQPNTNLSHTFNPIHPITATATVTDQPAMRRVTALVLALAAGSSSAFLLPAAAPKAAAAAPSCRHAPAAAVTAMRAAAAEQSEQSAIGLAEKIPEGELAEADKTPPPSTFFECTLQVL